MARFILIQDDDYERQYWEALNYLDSKYHDQPTRLKNIPDDDAENRYGHGKNTQHTGKNFRPGKQVI